MMLQPCLEFASEAYQLAQHSEVATMPASPSMTPFLPYTAPREASRLCLKAASDADHPFAISSLPRTTVWCVRASTRVSPLHLSVCVCVRALRFRFARKQSVSVCSSPRPSRQSPSLTYEQHTSVLAHKHTPRAFQGQGQDLQQEAMT